MKKLLVVVTTFNRRRITELSLRQMSRYKRGAKILVYDDHSTEFDLEWISQFADEVKREPAKLGIASLRARQFRDFINSEFDLLYFTDNDVIHDPTYILRLQRLYSLSTELKLPVSLYNSSFHNYPENILKEIRDVQIRITAPGVSQLYDREMVEQMLLELRHSPALEGRYGWDYHLPALLKRPWIQSTISYLEHFGAGGMHNSNSPDGYERDRALNPTQFLTKIRQEVIHYLEFGGKNPVF
jgi:glycosyltransferase involved in cell wall biosynthesis